MDFIISAGHPALPGHFPGRPVVPGVVLLDRVLDAVQAEYGVDMGALRLPQVKFMQPLLPEQTATVQLEGAAPRWRFRVLHGERLLASGELVAESAAEPPPA